MTTYYSETNQDAVLKIPANAARLQEKREIPCMFQEMKSQMLLLRAPTRPPAGEVVSVEYNDALFLGEIVGLAPTSNGHWQVEVQVEQVLSGLQSLMNLRDRLLGEGAGARVESSALRLCA